jgi:hypothetical protein
MQQPVRFPDHGSERISNGYPSGYPFGYVQRDCGIGMDMHGKVDGYLLGCPKGDPFVSAKLSKEDVLEFRIRTDVWISTDMLGYPRISMDGPSSQMPSRKGRQVLNLIVTSSQVTAQVAHSENSSFVPYMRGAFWSMQMIPPPS